MKQRVLIFTENYLPGVKGGGPIKSIKNLVDLMHKEIEFYIITSDRDLGLSEPYDEVMINQWNKVGNSRVFYVKTSHINFSFVETAIDAINPDAIYLNSFFSFKFSIFIQLYLKLKRINNIKVILAPRGEFSEGALQLKSQKKQLFINFYKNFLYQPYIFWHATAESEKKDIQRIFGEIENVEIVANFVKPTELLKGDEVIDKQVNELKLVFLSRIHPKKNLDFAIKALNESYDGMIKFDIYGPIEDKDYWEDCLKLINDLPDNIKVNYQGETSNTEVVDVFSRYHSFFFPTLGENFGHVIVESLQAGTPVLLSEETTPWKDLEDANAGWTIPLSDMNAFRQKINDLLLMNAETYTEFSLGAQQYINHYLEKSNDTEAMKGLLLDDLEDQ